MKKLLIGALLALAGFSVTPAFAYGYYGGHGYYHGGHGYYHGGYDSPGFSSRASNGISRGGFGSSGIRVGG